MRLCFKPVCPVKKVVEQAVDYFLKNNMPSCAEILCSFGKNPEISACVTGLFSKDEVKNSYLIFALGYELNKMSTGKDVMNNHMNDNVVKIVRSNYSTVKFQAHFGATSYLCANHRVESGGFEQAFLCSGKEA